MEEQCQARALPCSFEEAACSIRGHSLLQGKPSRISRSVLLLESPVLDRVRHGGSVKDTLHVDEDAVLLMA